MKLNQVAIDVPRGPQMRRIQITSPYQKAQAQIRADLRFITYLIWCPIKQYLQVRHWLVEYCGALGSCGASTDSSPGAHFIQV